MEISQNQQIPPSYAMSLLDECSAVRRLTVKITLKAIMQMLYLHDTQAVNTTCKIFDSVQVSKRIIIITFLEHFRKHSSLLGLEVLVIENFIYFWHDRACLDETMKWKFKEQYALDQRRAESESIRKKYPDRIPVIVEKAPRSTIPNIDKQKFLVPSDISVAQFMWIIRKRIQLTPEKAIFLFIGRVLPQSSASMGLIYAENVDEDGFLYVIYSGENTFGYV